jgi:hypothetical protein
MLHDHVMLLSGLIVYIVYIGVSAYVPKGTQGCQLLTSLGGSVLVVSEIKEGSW